MPWSRAPSWGATTTRAIDEANAWANKKWMNNTAVRLHWKRKCRGWGESDMWADFFSHSAKKGSNACAVYDKMRRNEMASLFNEMLDAENHGHDGKCIREFCTYILQTMREIFTLSINDQPDISQKDALQRFNRYLQGTRNRSDINRLANGLVVVERLWLLMDTVRYLQWKVATV